MSMDFYSCRSRRRCEDRGNWPTTTQTIYITAERDYSLGVGPGSVVGSGAGVTSTGPGFVALGPPFTRP